MDNVATVCVTSTLEPNVNKKRERITINTNINKSFFLNTTTSRQTIPNSKLIPTDII
ncbi:ORF230 [Staphylococcus phage Twort]|uniref:ORF230 n=1 Tax=Staphylococcus phage Twort (strain DSM 17442 / HER 48) TaxID=2908167 RepID=Q4Z903_BPTWO|nr:ORF230 [Staphylococcus phage Twort]AAX92471.1 ORF230 [Staphylococcus phage Twort]